MTIRYRRLLWVLVQLASLILHTTGERHLAGPIGNLTNTSPPRQEVVRRGEDGENSIEVMDSTQQVNNLLSSTQNIYTLDKRGDGKGMSRHLAAASYGAMLAMGTAAMGVTTYGIRLFDWNRYKKQIYTHSRETVSKQHLKDLRKEKNLGGSKSGSELKDVIPTHTTIIINNFINYNRNLQNNSNPHNSTVERRNTEEGKLSAASNKENEGAQIYAGDNFLVPQTGDQTAGLTLFIKQATLMRRAERLEVRLQGLHKNTRDRAPIYSSRQMPGAATVSKNKTLYHIKVCRSRDICKSDFDTSFPLW